MLQLIIMWILEALNVQSLLHQQVKSHVEQVPDQQLQMKLSQSQNCYWFSWKLLKRLSARTLATLTGLTQQSLFHQLTLFMIQPWVSIKWLLVDLDSQVIIKLLKSMLMEPNRHYHQIMIPPISLLSLFLDCNHTVLR